MTERAQGLCAILRVAHNNISAPNVNTFGTDRAETLLAK